MIFSAEQTGVGGSTDARMFYKGWGTTGIITIPQLTLNGGSLEHQNGSGDIFRVEGAFRVLGDSQIWAKQGPIYLDGAVSGWGTIRNPSSDSGPSVLYFTNPENSFRGSIVNNGRFELSEGAVMNFVVGAAGRSNSISGGGPATILNGILVIDLTNASTTVGDSWGLVTAGNRTYGETFEVAGFEKHGNFWISGSYLFDQGAGRLSVIDPAVPLFLQHPSNVTAFVGERVTLNSLAYSESAISYQWEYSADGSTWTEVNGAIEASLTIEEAPYSAAGHYRVRAQSGGESLVSNAATLGLEFGPPQILQGIANVTVREGDPHTFEVIAEGVGALTYEWSKDDVVQESVTGNVWDLGAVSASDAGVYSVTVTDHAAAEEGLEPTSVTLTVELLTFEAPPVDRAISLNFVGAASAGNPWGGSSELGVMAPGDEAGILPVANWNNSAQVNQVATQSSPLSVAENVGGEGVAQVTWSSNNTWAGLASQGSPADKTATDRMFHGYIETRSGSALGQTTVTFTQVPYPEYDVYVYLAGGDPNIIGRVWLDDGSGEEVFYKNVGSVVPRPYRLSTAATADAATADDPSSVVRFRGITGGTLAIAHTEATTGNSGGIAGISIVDTTPDGVGYPPIVTSGPVSRFVPGGSTVELSVTAVSQNDGGSLSYEWRRDGALVGSSATLSFNDVTSAATGHYTVTVTDSAAPSSPRTAEASLVVVDASRPALFSVDVQSGSHAPMHGHAILRTSGPVTVDPNNPRNDIGLGGAVEGDTIWNAVAAATGASDYANFVDAEGLSLTGLTLTVAGVTGVEDAPEGGGIDVPIEYYSGPLLRDYVFTEGEDEMTVTVGGLNSFVGKEVTLVVYAVGKESADTRWGGTRNDVATVTLAEANNFSSATPVATDQVEGRDLRYNNFAHAIFTANVAGNGTVSWTVGPVAGEPGLNAINGFQMLITDKGDHVLTTPLEDWRLAHFGTTENAGAAANTADFDGDGFSNLLEYALGADPTVPGSALGLVVVEPISGFLRLAFAHIDDSSLIYEIEATDDVSTGWTVVHTYSPFTEAGVQTFTDSVAIGEGQRRFLRLKVTAQ